MKRTTAFVSTALVAVLSVGTMMGCSGERTVGSQPEKETAPAAESTAANRSQDEVVVELKSAISNEPAFKSVTATEKAKVTIEDDSETTEDASADETSSEPEVLESVSTYQFDASGDKLKTSMTYKIGDVTMQYFSDGDDAVYVTDGTVYSGTTEQFGLGHFDGPQAYVESEIGDLYSIVDCAANVEKEQQGETSIYKLTLDVQKYIASDDVLTMMAESGNPVRASDVTLGFDKEGHMVLLDHMLEYDKSITELDIEFNDFDSTVVGPMPKATNTYEELLADEERKYADLDEEYDTATGDDWAEDYGSEARADSPNNDESK